ncbi:glycosyltransferase family 32 protein [Butyrivibrio sp. AE3006]|uniref:glycosyltransferase family 32 protein n=1 Tax=Butyrivibrio sp. AE3006 TaxID=1280673 RepID=UPI000419310B|nr:glycosyltransferase [Butyrivibrio sp. AE3006]
MRENSELENGKTIPHIIHYLWFGGLDKPENVRKCIASWQKYCPDFEIREWNEDNYDIHKHPFMEKAYKDKKWAFVSDYARLDVLYEYGGIYLDTDVELIKDITPLCENSGYIGFETNEFVNDGQGFGCIPKLPVIKEMLSVYDGDDVFGVFNGEEQFLESPKLRTMVLLTHGLKPDGSRQNVAGMEIYPVEYFAPKDYRSGKVTITPETYSIHHFDASWQSKSSRKYTVLMRICCRTLGNDAGYKLFQSLMKLKDRIGHN